MHTQRLSVSIILILRWTKICYFCPFFSPHDWPDHMAFNKRILCAVHSSTHHQFVPIIKVNNCIKTKFMMFVYDTQKIQNIINIKNHVYFSTWLRVPTLWTIEWYLVFLLVRLWKIGLLLIRFVRSLLKIGLRTVKT